MKLNNKLEDSYLVYEHTERGELVAIDKNDQKLIKQFWKSKKKGTPSESMISGFPFIQCQEHGTLKIDFDSPSEFEIELLKKF